MRLDALNAMDHEQAEEAFLRCCGSRAWAVAMTASRPFAGIDDVLDAGDRIWQRLGPAGWREAFAAHPRIGETARGWSEQEQSRVNRADDGVRARLAAANREYEARFGQTFIICATGRTADEILAVLERRLGNDPADELTIAADEQRRITRLRIARLLADDE